MKNFSQTGHPNVYARMPNLKMEQVRLYFCYLLFLPFLTIATRSIAQPTKDSIWVNLTIEQRIPSIHVSFAKHRYAGLGGAQSYTIIIKNLTSDKLEVSGKLFAELVSGGVKKDSFQVTIKPNGSVGGHAYVSDVDGLTGSVFPEDSPGERIPDPRDPKKTVINRIKSVGYENLVVKVAGKAK